MHYQMANLEMIGRGKDAVPLLLDEDGFTMHEGHVEEGFLLCFQMMIVTHGQGFLGKGQGLRICNERSRCFTMNVSGKLVQNDDFC